MSIIQKISKGYYKPGLPALLAGGYLILTSFTLIDATVVPQVFIGGVLVLLVFPMFWTSKSILVYQAADAVGGILVLIHIMLFCVFVGRIVHRNFMVTWELKPKPTSASVERGICFLLVDYPGYQICEYSDELCSDFEKNRKKTALTEIEGKFDFNQMREISVRKFNGQPLYPEERKRKGGYSYSTPLNPVGPNPFSWKVMASPSQVSQSER